MTSINAIGQPGCSDPDCGCGENACPIYDYSGASDLTNINIVDSDTLEAVDSPSTTMSGGVLTVAAGEVAYPTFGRGYCKTYTNFKDGSPFCSAYYDDYNFGFGGFAEGIFKWDAYISSTPNVIRFGETYKLPDGTILWPAQQIVQSGSATTGTWATRLDTDQCDVTSTVYNASAADMANSLSEHNFVDYADITLLPFTAEITGSVPNATYKLTFVGETGWACGLPGQIPELDVYSNLTDSGSFAVSILEAGPTLTPNSWWELSLTTSGSTLTYYGPNGNSSSADPTTPITLTLGYPYDSPCNQTIGEGWHSIAFTRIFTYAGVGPDALVFTIQIDGKRIPLFRIPNLDIPRNVIMPDDYSYDEMSGSIFAWFSEGYISGPSFRENAVIRKLKVECYRCPITISCGYEEHENDSAKQYLSITGADLSELVADLPDTAFYNETTAATDTDLRTILAGVASGDIILKRTSLAKCDEQSPIAYAKQCKGKFNITPLTGNLGAPYGTPTVVDFLDSSDYPNGFIVNAALVAGAARIYDYWAVQIRAYVNSMNHSSTQQYAARLSTYVSAIFISCPAAVDASVSARASLPLHQSIPLDSYPRYLFPGVEGGIGTTVDEFAFYQKAYNYIGFQKLDGKGWWQNVNGFIGQNNPDGDPQVGIDDVGDITITPTDTPPDSCLNRKATYTPCEGEGGSNEIVQTNTGPPVITLGDGRCAEFLEWEDDDATVTGTIGGSTSSCLACVGCNCCESKIASIDFSVNIQLDLYKFSPLGTGGTLLCMSFSTTYFATGDADSDNHCRCTPNLSFYPISGGTSSALCINLVPIQSTVGWTVTDGCSLNVSFYLILGTGARITIYLTGTLPSGDCFSEPVDLICTGVNVSTGYILKNTTYPPDKTLIYGTASLTAA